MECQFRENIPVILNENFRLLNNPGIQLLIIQFPLYYMTDGRLQKVKNKKKIQTLSSRRGRGRLRQVPNRVIWLGNSGKLVAEERCSQPEVRLYRSGWTICKKNTLIPIRVLYTTDGGQIGLAALKSVSDAHNPSFECRLKVNKTKISDHWIS